MTTLSDFRDSVVESLSTALTCDVFAVGGVYGADELRRHVVRAPCVLVALINIRPFDNFAQSWESGAVFVAYVVTRDTPEYDRDTLAMRYATDILQLLSANPVLGTTTTSVVNQNSIEANNLYSGALDSVQVALWSVTWTASLVGEEG